MPIRQDLLLILKWRKLGRTVRPLETRNDRTVARPCVCCYSCGLYTVL
uniref:Mlo8 n=1 Tax=Arundo donax TaxID=35708 RepID=A0A0A8XPT0_ARUDO